MKKIKKTIEENRAFLIAKGNDFCRSMVARGGGVVGVSAKVVDESDVTPFVIVSVDVFNKFLEFFYKKSIYNLVIKAKFYREC